MDERTREQLREHYIIEKELAAKLRCSDREERRQLYATLYDELFERVPHHPQLTGKGGAASRRRAVEIQRSFLEAFLRPDSVFMEIGCGDCLLSLDVAKNVKRVIGIDVSKKVSDSGAAPDNFELVISDGTSINVPPGSVDIAYSNQLLEHLHPDDVPEHIRNVYRALAPGGRYVFSTPHRYAGPHDISKYFEREAKGLHLHEFTIREIISMLEEAGFSGFYSYKRYRRRYMKIPGYPLVWIENVIGPLPHTVRRMAANIAFRAVRMVAVK
jgi:SAM-dependent methyltransferase